MEELRSEAVEIRPGQWWLVGGETIYSTHPPDKCSGVCPLHHPSPHHMRTWPQHLSHISRRGATNLHAFMWRKCPHGKYHPDPDQECGREGYDGKHLEACDGCCAPAPLTREQIAEIRASLKSMGDDLARGL